MKSPVILSIVLQAVWPGLAQTGAADWLNVRDCGASGSKFETTAETTAGSNQITVTNVGDFKVGQGVMVSKCNIRYTPTQLWGTGEPYYNQKPLQNSVEVRGYDGSAGSWTVYILDIEDMSKPKLISHANTSPSFPHPTHTCLVMPDLLKGRKVMVVADEDVAKLWPSAPAFAWTYDITQETSPVPISTFQVPGLDKDGSPQPPMTGCHQPSERFAGSIVPFAWFAQGLRLVDYADPFAPKEVGHYVPAAAPGADRASSNDVTIDNRGLIYLVDRVNGVDIIEASAVG